MARRRRGRVPLIGLVDISAVALLYRLRRCGDWFSLLIGLLLASAMPKTSRGRLIRIIRWQMEAVPGLDRAIRSFAPRRRAATTSNSFQFV